jgi:hypothetical protein
VSAFIVGTQPNTANGTSTAAALIAGLAHATTTPVSGLSSTSANIAGIARLTSTVSGSSLSAVVVFGVGQIIGVSASTTAAHTSIKGIGAFVIDIDGTSTAAWSRSTKMIGASSGISTTSCFIVGNFGVVTRSVTVAFTFEICRVAFTDTVTDNSWHHEENGGIIMWDIENDVSYADCAVMVKDATAMWKRGVPFYQIWNKFTSR